MGYTKKYRILLWILAGLICGLYAVTISRSSTIDALYYYNDLESGDFRLLLHPHHLIYEPLGKLVFEASRLCGYTGRSDIPLQLMSLYGSLGALVLFGLSLFRLGIRGHMALLSTAIFGVCYLPWHFATQGEPAAFFLLFSCWLIYQLLGLVKDQVTGPHQTARLALIWSFGILFHQAMILAAPVVLWVLLRSSRPACRYTNLGILSGILLLLVGVPYVAASAWVTGHLSLINLIRFATGYLEEFSHVYGRSIHLQPVTVLRGLAASILGGTALKSFVYSDQRLNLRLVLAIVPFVLVGAGFFIGVVRLLFSYQAMKTIRRSQIGVLVFFALIFMASAIYWEPANRKFWAPVLPCLIMLATLGFGSWFPVEKPTFRALWPRLVMALLLPVLLLGNLSGGILDNCRCRDDRIKLGLQLRTIYTPGDLVILPDCRLWQSLDYYFPDIRSHGILEQSTPDRMGGSDALQNVAKDLRDTLQAGGNVYVSSSLCRRLLGTLASVQPPGAIPPRQTELFEFSDPVNPIVLDRLVQLSRVD